jgi:hypothetical protein
MKQCCPECGHVGPLTAFAAEAEAREALAIAARLPGALGDPVLRYLALFRPAKRALAWPRALKLLQQLAADIERGAITRRGRDWAAPQAAWAAALASVTDQREALTLPLKDHSYLYEILCRGANRAEAGAEAQRETRRRQRTPTAAKPDPDKRTPVPAALRGEIDRALTHPHAPTTDPKNEA